ncbi:hypothetical protein FQN57_002996 [Myotisia sp. PD_48]|nr:hypothetical protein FQN57_002996 [Myotisia sp. PD_48]
MPNETHSRCHPSNTYANETLRQWPDSQDLERAVDIEARHFEQSVAEAFGLVLIDPSGRNKTPRTGQCTHAPDLYPADDRDCNRPLATPLPNPVLWPAPKRMKFQLPIR